MNQLIVLRIVCLVIGYVFGLFQTAYLLGKSKGIDIREHGSGNAGTTNPRILGQSRPDGFLGDMLKSLIAILLVGALFGKSHPEAVYLLKVWTFAGVVLGMTIPFIWASRAAKASRSWRVRLPFHWSFIPAGSCFLYPLSDYQVCVARILLLYLRTWMQLIIEGRMGMFGISGAMLIEIVVIQGILTFMAWYRHR